MKDMAPISVQLYNLREASKKDFDQALSRVADIGYNGYNGVEPFHLFGKSPTEFRQQVEDLGMRVSSTHLPWANRFSINEVVDVVSALGLRRAAGGFAPEDFADTHALQRTIEITQRIVEDLAKHDMTLCLHNHWWEFDHIDGRPAYHHLQEAVPNVEFELDTYWAANFGTNNVAVEIARIKDRMPLMHIKDGPMLPGQPHVALGSGTIDIPALFNAADQDVLEWSVIELDDCATDMMSAVATSYAYLLNLRSAD